MTRMIYSFNPLLIGSSEFFRGINHEGLYRNGFQSPLDRVLRVFADLTPIRDDLWGFNPLLIGSSEF